MFRKYAAVLLPAIIFLLGGVQTALADGVIDRVEAGQLIVLVGGAIATFFLPLASGAWAGALKVGSAVLVAGGALVIPLVFGFSAEALVIFALAVLSAVATEIGVESRIEATA